MSKISETEKKALLELEEESLRLRKEKLLSFLVDLIVFLEESECSIEYYCGISSDLIDLCCKEGFDYTNAVMTELRVRLKDKEIGSIPIKFEKLDSYSLAKTLSEHIKGVSSSSTKGDE